MKKILFFSLILSLAAAFVACDNEMQLYKDKLKKERKAIDDYIDRKKIKVLNAPKLDKQGNDTVYAENEYYKTPSGLYFRLDKLGVGAESDTLKSRQTMVLYYYYKMVLDATSDTIFSSSNWKDSEPARFVYGIDYPNIAFLEAVGLMKKAESQAQLIVPSAIGFSGDSEAVQPYLYTLRIAKFAY